MIQRIIIGLLILFIQPLQALSLFGLDLQQVTRDELRNAVKSSGARLIAASRSDALFDTYASDMLLAGSSQMHFGFVKRNNKLAFVEYEFIGLQQPQILQLLSKKYGNSQLVQGDFISDSSYQWRVDSMKIVLYQDWAAYKTRLVYIHPQNLALIRNEYKEFTAKEHKEAKVNVDQAY